MSSVSHHRSARSVPSPWLLALVFVALSSQARAGSIAYSVNVDTCGISGTSGYIDFQFNPANSASLAATALVNSFSTNGTLGAALPNLGDAVGTLPGALSFDNGTPTNEITQGLVFGSTISFDVTLGGLAVGSSGPASTTFFLTLYDANGNPYCSGPGGSIGTININADGSTTPTTYPPLAMPGPTATISPLSSVPEPSSLVLAAAGAALIILWARGDRRRPSSVQKGHNAACGRNQIRKGTNSQILNPKSELPQALRAARRSRSFLVERAQRGLFAATKAVKKDVAPVRFPGGYRSDKTNQRQRHAVFSSPAPVEHSRDQQRI